jgi:hypothetical protein
MNVRTRSTAAGALALFTAATVIAFGGPAHAAGGSNLALSVSDKKIATDSLGKTFSVKVTNNGPDDVGPFDVEFDVSGLDTSKVTFNALPDITGCESTAATTILCSFEGLGFEKDLTVKIPFALDHTPGQTGAAGSFAVKVVDETDPDLSDNEATVHVEIPGSGVDLGVFALDVSRLDENGDFTGEPLLPGETSVVFAGIVNQGDKVADGVKVSVKLPEHVTFAEVEEGCSYSADNRTVNCEYGTMQVAPEKFDPTVPFARAAFFPVTVAPDAPGPVNLTGGTFSAAALGVSDVPEGDVSTLAKQAPPKLPDNIKTLTADDLKDIDLSDNTDDFVVLVGAPPASGGGGGEGGLPVTGVQVGLIGGIGGAVLVTGAVLFILARRRRVVLVTPGDETPTA